MHGVRVTVARIARAVPLLNSPVCGPSMETSLQQARAHPWWDICDNGPEVSHPSPDCPQSNIGRDSQFCNAARADLGFQGVLGELVKGRLIPPLPIKRNMHADLALNPAHWAYSTSDLVDHDLSVNSDGPQNVVNGFDAPSGGVWEVCALNSLWAIPHFRNDGFAVNR